MDAERRTILRNALTWALVFGAGVGAWVLAVWLIVHIVG